MTKIIKEMLPPDVRVARDAQDLLIECCVGVYIFLAYMAYFIFIIVTLLLDSISSSTL